MLCGSMDKHAYILHMADIDKPKILQSFCNHSKYAAIKIYIKYVLLLAYDYDNVSVYKRNSPSKQ